MRRHIAGAARVSVDAPGAAHIGAFFEHHKTLFTGLLQAHGHAQAAKARPNDHHLMVGLRMAGCVAWGGAHAVS